MFRDNSIEASLANVSSLAILAPFAWAQVEIEGALARQAATKEGKAGRPKAQVEQHPASGLISWSVPVGSCGIPKSARAGTSRVRVCAPSTSEFDHRLEPAPEHPFAVERHLLRIHHLGKARVLHHLGVNRSWHRFET